MKRILSNKWFWIGVVALVVAAGLFLAYKFSRSELFVPLLWGCVIIAVLWVLSELGLRWWKKRKRKAFDEGLTAKEGIEDRKREWEGFQSELDKQKIDRYELPFYLLVGEPQSGKSVLLQNSDLHFPFGQNKLSGIGGTRGCDWWFTEEAVILDLAGRLFTHEGGVADQLEWEAFLDLLTNFRPICPANGILLVVPCDSLLSDSTDVSRQKANKIQAALLTLAKKLDAQLPIYLVLTKGDKLFGFAESVHRLEAPKRHEMFGWSRPAEKVDAMFDMEEARAGFREIVARARLLRGEMLGSARIPEALAEVDRMFAFPDELAALEEPLELYLRRVFTDSGLSDRLAFRGIYLTSGLQVGVPIARVCAQALGGSGDADMQDLEGLFTKQRAYFIKDLVRTRVFGERGLVRPTKGRVVAAQRRAVIGYGVSAAIALFSVIGGLVYLLSGSPGRVDELTKKVLENADDAQRARGWTVPDHLRFLASIRDAVDEERAAYEEAFSNSTRAEFEAMYVTAFDFRLVPTLRQAMQASAAAMVAGNGPSSFDKVKLAAECCTLLLTPQQDFATDDVLKSAEDVLLQGEREFQPKGDADAFTLKRAIDLRKQYSSEPAIGPAPAGTGPLQSIARQSLDLYEDCLTPGHLYHPISGLGYMLSWYGLDQAFAQLTAKEVLSNRNIFIWMRQYSESLAKMELCKPKLDTKTNLTYEIKLPQDIGLPMLALTRTRNKLAELLSKPGGTNGTSSDWTEADALTAFMGARFATTATDIDNTSFLNVRNLMDVGENILKGHLNKELEVPTEPRLVSMLSETYLAQVCRAAPNADWKLDTLGAEIEAGVRDIGSSPKASTAYLAKVLEVGRQFVARYPDWQSVTQARAADKPLAENQLAIEVVRGLAVLRRALAGSSFDSARTKEFREGVEKLMLEHLKALERKWTLPPAGAGFPIIDVAVLDTLEEVRVKNPPDSSDKVARAADGLLRQYLRTHRDAALEHWKERAPIDEATLEQPLDGADTIGIVSQIVELFSLMRERLGKPEPSQEDGMDLPYLEAVDEMLAERFRRHEEILKLYWTAEPIHDPARLPLLEVAGLTADRLDSGKIEPKIREAEAAVKTPDLNNQLLVPNTGVFRKLPGANGRLEALRTLRAPKDARAFRADSYVRQVVSLAEGLRENPTLIKEGAGLAERLRLVSNVPAGGNEGPGTLSGLYAWPLFDQLCQRMRQEVLKLFASDLERLLEREYGSTIDALYESDFSETKDRNDVEIMKSLAALLNRNGDLNDLKEKYNLSADTLGLVPTQEVEGKLAQLLAMQKFLTDLQAFFLDKDGKLITSAKITVKLEPVFETDSIWNLARGEKGSKAWFYFPEGTKSSQQATSPRMTGMLMEWSFSPDDSKSMRMRWSDLSNPTRKQGDPELEIFGSLAPLLFAWGNAENPGEKDEDDSWRVVVIPRNSTSRAPFRVSFGDRNLPERPARD